jgi:hypothetical protein
LSYAQLIKAGFIPSIPIDEPTRVVLANKNGLAITTVPSTANCYMIQSAMFKTSDPEELALMAITSKEQKTPITKALSAGETSSAHTKGLVSGNIKVATMIQWHRRLAHLNYPDILRLSRTPGSQIKVSDPQSRPFCEYLPRGEPEAQPIPYLG